MKILLVGGSGYLGSVLTPKLLEKGHEITVLDILMFGAEGLIPHLNNPRFTLIKADIRNKVLLKKIFLKNKFDAVINLAAIMGEPACKIDPNLAKDINTKSVFVLAKLAKESGIKRFIFTSSASNYGVSAPNDFASEKSRLNPLSLYAQTKVDAEKKLISLNNENFSICILRLAMLFGLSPRMNFNLLINEMTRDAFFGKTIVVYKENAWRPFTHIYDASNAIILVLNAKKEKITGKIFNVASQNYRKKDVVGILSKVFKKIKIEKKEAAFDNRDYKISFEKIKKELKFKPQRTVEQGVEEINWALKNNLFSDPHNKNYNMWINEELFLK